MSSRFSFLSRIIFCLLLSSGHSWAGTPAPKAPADALIGVWLTEGYEGGVEIYHCGTALCGKLYWLKPSDKPDAEVDDKNPDPKLRNRPLCGLTFMGGFEPQPDGSLSDGWIYSPRHGAQFGASMAAGEDDTLDLRGYLLLPLLGETQTWTRASNLSPCWKSAGK